MVVAAAPAAAAAASLAASALLLSLSGWSSLWSLCHIHSAPHAAPGASSTIQSLALKRDGGGRGRDDDAARPHTILRLGGGVVGAGCGALWGRGLLLHRGAAREASSQGGRNRRRRR